MLERFDDPASFLLVPASEVNRSPKRRQEFSFQRPSAMKKPPVSLLTSNYVDSHQMLAVAVIRQAVVDATNPSAANRVRAAARAFLANSAMMRQWCDIAGIDPSLVRERCAKRAS
jgi:hypothetical protein